MTGASQDPKSALRQCWSRVFARLEDPKYISEFPSEESMYVNFFLLCAFDDFDLTLQRFLRARKFHLEQSTDMLMNAISWRASIGLRDIMLQGEAGLNEMMIKASMYFIWGQDKAGRPIVFLNMHNFIPPRSEKETVELRAVVLYAMENARLFLDSEQNTSHGVLGLADLSSFARKNIDLEFSRIFIEIFQNYFPEILGKALVVGSGLRMALFEGVWRFGKYFMDPEVRKKVSFCRPNQLTEYVDTEFIPISLGGHFDEAKLYELDQRNPLRHEEVSRTPSAKTIAELDGEFIDASKKFIALTREWIYAEGKPTEAKIEAERNALKKQCKLLWRKEIAVRPLNLYQRLGLIDPKGIVNWDKARTMV
ncbi:sec14 cytosolic factor family protein [Schizosaccharomyces japonicus yFS275]|uniref:Sec14 cytosolic factor family protein n=1 Tax=Schizosaccharomyces japonicus (strain yFS275 / FY16936) TaxID=402676 RepID=B6K3I7_SCHJY|nr:sec14 cytosolic factor family protein [Schizosaccharomyces japonicus yFS275]EEB08044.1 sec14 cytosolic factor family protein [Schizosaccharomyces japonicus yFS275]